MSSMFAITKLVLILWKFLMVQMTKKFIKFLLMTSRIMHLQKTILFNILLTTTLVLISFLLMDSDPH